MAAQQGLLFVERLTRALRSASGNASRSRWVVSLAVALALGPLLALPASGAGDGFGSITGGVFLDLDANLIHGPGEVGLAKARVALVGEGSTRDALSDDTGRYLFEDVRTGSYDLVLDLPRGYRQVQHVPTSVVVHRGALEQGPQFPLQPAPGHNVVRNGSFEQGLDGWIGYSAELELVDEGQSGEYAVSLKTTCPTYIQEPSEERELPTPHSPNGTVVGRVFLDQDGDGLRSATEPGLADVTLELSSESPHAGNYRTQTDNNGTYHFEKAHEGSYSMSVVVPPGLELVQGGARFLEVHRAVVEQGPDFAMRDLTGSGPIPCTAYNLDDYPDTVPHPRQGEQYVAWAWVRADSDSAEGKLVELRLREQGGALEPQESASVLARLHEDDWQLVQVTHTIAQPDRTVMDLIVTQILSTRGDAFQVDNISLALGAPVGPLGAPLSLTATPTAEGVALAWSGVEGAGGYLVERLEHGRYVQIATMPFDATAYLDLAAAESNTLFSYRVRAFNAAGGSAYSMEVQTTEAQPAPSP